MVVSFVQFLDDGLFPLGQVPDFGGQLIAGKGLLSGHFAGGGAVATLQNRKKFAGELWQKLTIVNTFVKTSIYFGNCLCKKTGKFIV